MTPRIVTGWDGFDDGRKRRLCMIPGIPRQKKPLVKCKHFQELEPSDDEVAEWKATYRTINPLIITGEISGILVVDQDGVLGYCEIGKRGKFPATVIVETPRGEFHEHYWFKYPADLGYIHGFTSGYYKDIPKVDLRADGGLAVYPGAIHKDGQIYRFKAGRSPDEVEIADLPGWLYDYIRAHNEKLAAEQAERQRVIEYAERQAQLRETSVVLRVRHAQGCRDYNDRLHRYAEAARRNQLQKVAEAAPDTRNNQLNKSAYALAPFLNEGLWSEAQLEHDLEQAAIRCGLDSDPNCGLPGIRRTIRSGLRAGRRNRIILSERSSPQLRVRS